MRPCAQGTIEGTRGGPPVRWVATSRVGGVSAPPFDELNLATHVGDDPDAVGANRAQLAQHLGLQAASVAVLTAEHGARVLRVAHGGPLPLADAAVTTHEGVGLLALAADCAPVVLADADAGVIAAVHCGWRGLVAGVVPAAVREMRLLGATRISAVIGPTICPNCYPVGPDCVDAIATALPPSIVSIACVGTREQPRVDVAGAVRALLLSEDVEVTSVEACTAEHSDLYSHRRDGRTGRHGMIVAR